MYSKNWQVNPFLYGEANLDGFMLPGHVCPVIGYEEYEQFTVFQKKIP